MYLICHSKEDIEAETCDLSPPSMFTYGRIKHGRWSKPGVIKFLAELLIRHQTYHFSIDLSVIMCKSALKIWYSWHFAKKLYSLVCFALFCLVKRIIEYFAKEWSEQKVSITDDVGLYSTYQKYIMIGAPNSYQFRENWTWVF